MSMRRVATVRVLPGMRLRDYRSRNELDVAIFIVFPSEKEFADDRKSKTVRVPNGFQK